MARIDIWIDGFSVQGNSAEASLLTSIEADNFDDAVKKYMKSKKPGTVDVFDGYRNGGEGEPLRVPCKIYRIWGCQLHDNEADARKAFG